MPYTGEVVRRRERNVAPQLFCVPKKMNKSLQAAGASSELALVT